MVYGGTDAGGKVVATLGLGLRLGLGLGFASSALTRTLTLTLIQVIETASAYDIVSGQWHEVEGVVPRSGLRMTSRGGEP